MHNDERQPIMLFGPHELRRQVLVRLTALPETKSQQGRKFDEMSRRPGSYPVLCAYLKQAENIQWEG